MSDSRYIAIEGPIGVGKTSLAKRLAESLESELLLEEADANPFLERFYQDPRGHALPAQLFFLFQRIRQIDDLRQADMFSETRPDPERPAVCRDRAGSR
jgi:deoxyadenosine/deoxycytidine kinase